jgi:hypothetical protein
MVSGQHLKVGGLELEDDGATGDGFATPQHRLERLRRSNQDGRMRVVKIEKSLFSRQ